MIMCVMSVTMMSFIIVVAYVLCIWSYDAKLATLIFVADTGIKGAKKTKEMYLVLQFVFIQIFLDDGFAV